MTWYYAVGGNQAGPVSDEEFQHLAAAGVIQPHTLVWREGMSGWLPYSAVMGGATTPGMASAIATPYGLDAYDDFEYAGFWIRFGAIFIDTIISIGFQFVVGLIIGFTIAFNGGNTDAWVDENEPYFNLLGFVFGILYATLFLGSRLQATPGMMICRIRIIVDDGSDCNFLRAFGRYFAAILSKIILFIGYFLCAIDDEKRTLHDMICNTRVIKK